MTTKQDRVSQRLRLNELRMLHAVARWGSMSKAAAHLNISQSAISKAIGELERLLGVSLLDRTPVGVEPTVFGNALIARGNAVFDELRLALSDIEFLTDPSTGEVRIGCDEPFAGLIAASIERLRRRHPHIVCHMIQSPFTATLEFRELHERRVDLMLARVPDPFREKDLHADVVFHDRVYVVAGRRNKWARRHNIKLSDLIGEPWILTPSSSLPTALAHEAFRASGVRMPTASVISQSVHLRNSLLMTGRYLTVLPGSYIRFNPLRSSLRVLPVDLKSTPQPIAIVAPAHRRHAPITQRFIECIHEVSKPLTTDTAF